MFTPHSKTYTLDWPMTPENLRNIDEMLQTLFDDLRNGLADLNSGLNTNLVSSGVGLTGISGFPGTDGEDGLDGTPGARGDEGPTGPLGPQGPIGMGVPGVDGEDGVDGWPGERGNEGATGLTGAQGSMGMGVPGLDGEDGLDGWPGDRGPSGNDGTPGAPGSSGTLTTRRVAFLQAPSVGTTVTQGLNIFGYARTGPVGTPTNTTDDVSAWMTLTSGTVSGNAAYEEASSNQQFCRAEHDPIFYWVIRTGTITSIRIWLGLSTSGIVNNADDLSASSVKGICFRYSTVAGDGGWVGVCSSGTHQTVSSTVAAIAANTVYTLKCRVSSGVAYFSVNGGAEQTVAVDLPVSTSLYGFGGVATQTSAARTFEWAKFYMEANGAASV